MSKTPEVPSTPLLDPATWSGCIFDGGWRPGAAGDAAVVEPATGDELGRTGLAGADDVARSACRAAEAQREWAAAPFEERAAILRRAGDLWERQAADVEWWLIREAGSIPPKAAVETHAAAQECYEAAALSSHALGEILPTVQPG